MYYFLLSIIDDTNMARPHSSQASDPSARHPTVKYAWKLNALAEICLCMMLLAVAAVFFWLLGHRCPVGNKDGAVYMSAPKGLG